MGEGVRLARQTMRLARYYRPGDIRLEEVPLPSIGLGELLVRMEVCGVCGSDTMEWYLEKKAPVVLGHEPVGTVVALGPGVTDFQEGDRVFVHHHVPCLTCRWCRRGSYTLCPTFHETHLDPGGFSEFVRVPAPIVQRDTLKLPPHVSNEAGALIEPIACCLRGFKRSGFRPMGVGEGGAGGLEQTVAVIGCGFTGLIQVQLAKQYNASLVIAIDLVPFRLELARRMGADAAWDANTPDLARQLLERNQGRGADTVFVCAGRKEAVQLGFELVEAGGTVHLFAPTKPGEMFPVDGDRLFFQEITLNSTYSASHLETREALGLLANGQLQVDPLITHRFPLTHVGEALQLAAHPQDSLKILVTLSAS